MLLTDHMPAYLYVVGQVSESHLRNPTASVGGLEGALRNGAQRQHNVSARACPNPPADH